MDFTLVGDGEAGTLEPEVESADPREKRRDAQRRMRRFEVIEEGTITASNRFARPSVFAVSHSHTITRLQPNALSRLPFSASRATFRLSFRVQYALLLFGFLFLLPRRQSWPCQKHPWMKTATFHFGKTKSGQPGKSFR
jgi:hypothetical protein